MVDLKALLSQIDLVPKDITWPSLYRMGIGVGVGFLVGAVVDATFFSKVQDRVVTETIIQKEEVIKWQTKEVIKTVVQTTKQSQTGKSFNRYSEKLPDGTVRLWEQTSETVATADGQTSTNTQTNSASGSQATTSTQSTKTTTEGSKSRYSLGLLIDPRIFISPLPNYATVIGAMRFGNLPLSGMLGYTYPLDFRLGFTLEF